MARCLNCPGYCTGPTCTRHTVDWTLYRHHEKIVSYVLLILSSNGRGLSGVVRGQSPLRETIQTLPRPGRTPFLTLSAYPAGDLIPNVASPRGGRAS